MPISEEQRAGHALRVKAPRLAQEIVAEYYRLRPDLAERYGPSGRRHCLQDAEYHLRFLASSVEAGDPRLFANYVAWARDILVPRGIPAEELKENLRVMRQVIEGALTPEAAAVACRHIDVAL